MSGEEAMRFDFTVMEARLRDEGAHHAQAANLAEGQRRNASAHYRALRRVKARIHARRIEARIICPRPQGSRRRRTQRTRRTGGSRSPDSSSEPEPPGLAAQHGGQA